ncbi:hypothetical protein BKA64DRAFT_714278 [Cadophora sp. MPI-SDFR-AT-0126]|nr:hypothetical protein BKA64DRAFT_714278 [Leotiomycetes sp. MPI-SDFR-AT-0126]
MTPDLAIAITAMAVSLCAFVIACAQALQQYFGTAEGFRRCQASVIDQWAKLTDRNFTLKNWEFRFETRFAVPALLMYDPTDPNPTSAGRRVIPIDGSDASYAASMITKAAPLAKAENSRQPPIPVPTDVETGVQTPGRGSRHRGLRNVPTETPKEEQQQDYIEDELATWVLLLRTLQEYQELQREEFKGGPLHPEISQITLVPAVKVVRKSWDFMQPDIVKPYAISTVNDIVIIMHQLGLEWSEFDPKAGRMQADSNHIGLSVTSSWVRGLGAMLFFYTSGRHVKSGRPSRLYIPNRLAAVLGFGYLPRSAVETGSLDHPEWPIQNGAFDHIIGRYCGVEFAKKMRLQAGELSNCISVYSELPALVAPVFRLKDSKLTRIRRPSADITLVHLSKLLLGPFFLKLMRTEHHPGDEISNIKERCEKILNELGVGVSLQEWLDNFKQRLISVWKDNVQSREPGNLLLEFGSVYENADDWTYAIKMCLSNLVVLTSKNDQSGYDPAIQEPERHLRLSQTKKAIEDIHNELSGAWYDRLKVFVDAVASNKADLARLDLIHETWEYTNQFFLKENKDHIDRQGFGAIRKEYRQDASYKQYLSVYLKAMASYMDEFRSAANIPQDFASLSEADYNWQRAVKSMEAYFDCQHPQVIKQLQVLWPDLGFSESETWANTVWSMLFLRGCCWHLLHDFSKNASIVGSEWYESKMPVYIG